MRTLLFGLFIIVTLSQCKTTNINSRYTGVKPTSGWKGSPGPGMPNEPGKCFAKCLIESEYETLEESYVVFTGDISQEDVDVEKTTIITKPKRREWIKKKADKNCIAEDPEDCLVWCLVELEQETEQLYILRNTSQTENYEIKTVQIQKLVKEGGFTEWREVVCKEDITDSFIMEIQTLLQSHGYYSGKIKGEMTQDAKLALTTFQRDNKLPIGQLDMMTLEALIKKP